MNSHTLQWLLLIVPWLTLLFMKKDDVKRFMPVGLLTALSSAIIGEIGSTLQFWRIGETVFPFSHTATFSYGAVPVAAMWVFKFTYERFWLYVATNAILDAGFAYMIFPWLVSVGILSFVRSSFIVYAINWGHQMILYGYQMWQDDIFTQKTTAGTMGIHVQPATAKPLPVERNSQDKK